MTEAFKLLIDPAAIAANGLLDKKHPIQPITTRRYHAGTHAVDVRINGVAQALATFELQLVGAQHNGATALK